MSRGCLGLRPARRPLGVAAPRPHVAGHETSLVSERPVASQLYHDAAPVHPAICMFDVDISD